MRGRSLVQDLAAALGALDLDLVRWLVCRSAGRILLMMKHHGRAHHELRLAAHRTRQVLLLE
jgi:hypothetical protein